MGSTVLLTHLKIILLQCFQFSKINFIQIDPISRVEKVYNMGGATATKGFMQLDMVLKKGTPKELTVEPYEVRNSQVRF